MEVTQSAELAQVLAQAQDIAGQTEQGLSTAHVLLAMFTVPNLAELLLLERSVNEETLLANIDRMEREPEGSVEGLEASAARIARGCDDAHSNCLHLLAALTRMPQTFAFGLLQRTGVDMGRLRVAALRYATHGVPSRVLRTAEPEEIEEMHETSEYHALPGDTAVDLPAIGREVPVEAHVTVQRPAVHRRRAADRRQADRGRRQSDLGGGGEGRELEGELEGEETDQGSTSPYVVDESYEWLGKLGRNLSHLAWAGDLDPVIGRHSEVEQAIDILNKRRSNNPCLVGDPGVGKTAIAEGMALRLVETGAERVLIQVDVGAILAGTHLRGALAERLRGLQEEVKAAEGKVVVFIDEIHTLMGAGGGDAGHDAANELKAALARGEFPCVGATTVDEFRQYIEADPAMERRFTPVHVEEPEPAETLQILEGVVGRYAEHHGVQYLPESLEAAVRLSRRYLHDRCDPDKSLGVLDLAGAVARRGEGPVGRREVAEVVARYARVPVEHLLLDAPQRFLEMEAQLAERIIGQGHALQAIAETVRRNLAGFSGGRPVGSLLFLGPTGVGKTEAAKALANFLFGGTNAMTRFDMSEFSEKHTLARLIGAPPGYVGHEHGGELTDSVRRRPYQVLLLDEIEKGHREVWNLLLQVLDDGRLTDGRGRTVDFSNTVIIMTSNLGVDAGAKRIGFAGGDDREAAERRTLEAAKRAFPPELWNRIECRLVFHPLSQDEVRRIARILLTERAKLLMEERGIDFAVADSAIDLLIDRGGYDPALGARPMRQTIAREIESRLAERILSGDLVRGDHVDIDGVDAALRFRRKR